MRKTNPKQLFVISTISRKDIADLLNEARDAAGAAPDVDKFRKDDPRLTRAVCQKVADLILDAENNVDDRTADCLEEAVHHGAGRFLCSLPEKLRRRPKPRRR